MCPGILFARTRLARGPAPRRDRNCAVVPSDLCTRWPRKSQSAVPRAGTVSIFLAGLLAAPLSPMSAARFARTVELVPSGNGTRLTYTEQGAYFDDADAPVAAPCKVYASGARAASDEAGGNTCL